MKQKVIAAMSGGVDSSVAAALLIEQGYDVIGITINVWQSEESLKASNKTCCSISDVDDARRVCYRLGIPHYVLNMRDLFKSKVIDYFFDEYLSGRTPNPCIACNAHVKFSALMLKAETLGADYVATGHYAIIDKYENGQFCLRMSCDSQKDQTYVLYMLNQQQLSKLLMPCGNYIKSDIRKIAQKYDLPTSHKADSQDLCFVGSEGYASFIRSNCAELAKPGKVMTKDGRVLGTHDGIFNFTIGQRKGLHIYTQEQFYVTEIDSKTATVYVGGGEELLKMSLKVTNVNHMLSGEIYDGRRCMVKIRYNSPEKDAVLSALPNGEMKVTFDEPQRAITPGQAAVFYHGGVVLGGGTIESDEGLL